MAEGLLLVPAGTKVVRFVPPLIVSAAEIDKAVSIIDRVFANI
jgi:acetylornithine/N-succinyldiaminopimelate aminotransferase